MKRKYDVDKKELIDINAYKNSREISRKTEVQTETERQPDTERKKKVKEITDRNI